MYFSTFTALPSFSFPFAAAFNASFDPFGFNVNPLFSLRHSYENQFIKNLGLVKSKFKKSICEELSFERIYECVQFLATIQGEKRRIDESLVDPQTAKHKIYCFLGSLAIYEVYTQTSHESYVSLLF